MDMAAAVMRASFDDRLPHLAGRHTPAEDLGFFRDILFPSCQLWGAFEQDTLLGIIAFSPGEIQQLYIHPGAQRRGLGSALLSIAMSASSAAARPLELWTFQCNAAARHFYQAHGFIAIACTDGTGNEDQAPDVRYRWTPAPPGSHPIENSSPPR
jgi:ribosomal protein S18 acetylase RimI-like enzyme